MEIKFEYQSGNMVFRRQILLLQYNRISHITVKYTCKAYFIIVERGCVSSYKKGRV